MKYQTKRMNHFKKYLVLVLLLRLPNCLHTVPLQQLHGLVIGHDVRQMNFGTPFHTLSLEKLVKKLRKALDGFGAHARTTPHAMFAHLIDVRRDPVQSPATSIVFRARAGNLQEKKRIYKKKLKTRL